MKTTNTPPTPVVPGVTAAGVVRRHLLAQPQNPLLVPIIKPTGTRTTAPSRMDTQEFTQTLRPSACLAIKAHGSADGKGQNNDKRAFSSYASGAEVPVARGLVVGVRFRFRRRTLISCGRSKEVHYVIEPGLYGTSTFKWLKHPRYHQSGRILHAHYHQSGPHPASYVSQ